MAATPRKVDLRNVKEGNSFRTKRKPEGDYVAKIMKVEDHVKEGKTPGWVFTVKIKGDEASSYPIYANPDEKQVWKLAKLFTAAGVKLPKKIVKIDPNKLVGKMVGVFLEDDEYNGKPKSSISDFMLVSEVVPPADQDDQETDDEDLEDEEIDTGDEDDDDDEEEVIPEPVKRKSKKAPEPEPEDDDDEDEDDEEEDDKPPVKKRKAKPAPPPVEDEDDEDDDEEEPEPTPPPKKRAKKKAKPTPVDDEDDDLDLDEL
jgi:hypothetical protein